MPDARDLLTSYRDVVGGLSRAAGPAGALFAPMALTADVLEQLLDRQQDLEAQLGTVLQPLGVAAELARDTPANLRTQAKAFEAASLSFHQAAELMNRQADLLERTLGLVDVPKGLLRTVRPPKDAPGS